MASCAKALLMSISPVIATLGAPHCRHERQAAEDLSDETSKISAQRFTVWPPSAPGSKLKSAAQFALSGRCRQISDQAGRLCASGAGSAGGAGGTASDAARELGGEPGVGARA